MTETSFKQHHPDVYACPFITCKVRGRNVIKMWAVRRIQKNIRLYLARKRDKEQAKKKAEDSKKRWAKKIQGTYAYKRYFYHSELEYIKGCGKTNKYSSGFNPVKYAKYRRNILEFLWSVVELDTFWGPNWT